MATEYAWSRLEHGAVDKDGKDVKTVVEEGDTVPDGLFSDEELDALRAVGAVSEQPKGAQAQADALTAANAEIDRLKAELAAAKGGGTVSAKTAPAAKG